MNEIVPIAMPGTHEKFLEYFEKQEIPKTVKILDLGAGHGAFTKRLYDMKYDVRAADLFPEIFRFEEVECTRVDITETFPYPDNTFDIVIAIEVSEHIADHENFFKENSRILKPGGKLYISTPNILSMKSRWRFLFTGFFQSFHPLELKNYDGLQHINSRTIDQYNYIAIKSGFSPAEFEIDRKQKSSQWILFFVYPFMLIYQAYKKVGDLHNQRKLLLGRLLFLTFTNAK